PLAVAFTDASTGNVTAWAWDFGDSQTSTDRNATHTYAAPGTYSVTLNASNAYGYNISAATAISVLAPPVAGFSANATVIPTGSAVAFTDASTGNVTAWAWAFGDSQTSTDRNATHTYTAPGLYSVTLNASNPYGYNLTTFENYIDVGNPPAAGFTTNVTGGNAPLAVQFTDTSENTPTSWSWTFGDGNTSTDQSPAHTYAAAGTYTVTLTATNAYGEDGETKADVIAAYSPSPYSVATYADLCKVGTGAEGWTLDADYIQTADIQCPAGANFPRIGQNPGTLFTGTYDGCGYEIRDLHMEYSDFHTGMFICLGSSGVLQNITLIDVNVTSTQTYLGSLVGQSSGTISGCMASGNITGAGTLGGLVGMVDGGTITGSHTSCTIHGGDLSGGLIGYMTDGIVVQCNSSGTMVPSGSSASSVGGLIGDLMDGDLQTCTSSVAVMGWDKAGGLIGYMRAGTVTNCSASGPVSTGNHSGYAIGGLVGQIYRGSITDSSASGTVVVDSGNCIGGLIGEGGGGSLARCTATGSVSQTGSGGCYFGGLVGVSALSITECSASGNVSGGYSVGGLAGSVTGGETSDSYATGASTATEEPYMVAGLIGSLAGATVSSSYAVGPVSAPGASGDALTGRVGGLIGYIDTYPGVGVTEDCFWNVETSGQTSSRGSEVGKTTAELQTLATFSGWDIALAHTHAGETWYLFEGQDYPRLAWEGIPPAGAFTASPTTGVAPLTIQFTDTSTGSPTAWSWDLGDGGTSTVQHPQHIYTTAGTYTVALTVTTNQGNVSVTKPNLLTFYDPVTANFTADTTAGLIPLAVQFTDTSTGSPTAWNWTFGDGETSTAQSPAHTYAAEGNYTVTLTASNPADEDTETKTEYIKVFDPVTAAFTANETLGLTPMNVQFNDTSTGTPTSWLWDFGDDNTSALQNPAHTYAAEGNYTVTLTASNPADEDTETKTEYIKVF
ncbi:MAG: PKD domain-containing protein, partial [Bacilli bacterium]